MGFFGWWKGREEKRREEGVFVIRISMLYVCAIDAVKEVDCQEMLWEKVIDVCCSC